MEIEQAEKIINEELTKWTEFKETLEKLKELEIKAKERKIKAKEIEIKIVKEQFDEFSKSVKELKEKWLGDKK